MAQWSDMLLDYHQHCQEEVDQVFLSYNGCTDGWLDGNTKVGFDAHARVGKKNFSADGLVRLQVEIIILHVCLMIICGKVMCIGLSLMSNTRI